MRSEIELLNSNIEDELKSSPDPNSEISSGENQNSNTSQEKIQNYTSTWGSKSGKFIEKFFDIKLGVFFSTTKNQNNLILSIEEFKKDILNSVNKNFIKQIEEKIVEKDLDSLNKIKNIKEELITEIKCSFDKSVNTPLEIDSFFPQISGSKIN